MFSVIAYLCLDFIGYVRVSTRKQAVKGNSLVAQKAEIKEYARSREIKVSRWFSDDSSARNEDAGVERPGFKKACEHALKTGKPILVADLSRFTRTEKTLEDFLKAGGKLYGLDGFGDDEALMRARIKRAKIDGDRIAERTRDGHAKARAAGKTFGSPTPLNGARASAISRGKEADIRRRELERLRDEAANDGVTTIKGFTGWLNGKGHYAAPGTAWTPSNVRRVLKGRLAPEPAQTLPMPFVNDATMPSKEVGHFTPEEAEIIQEVINANSRLSEAQKARWARALNQPHPRETRDQALTKARASLEQLKAKKKAQEAAEFLENKRLNKEYGLF